MAEPEIHIKRIQEKVQRLLRQYQELQRENNHLKKDIEKLSKQSVLHMQTIETLREQVQVLRASSGEWDRNDKKEFEKRINQYIKEIEKCIALLSE